VFSQFGAVYFCILTKRKILHQEYRDREATAVAISQFGEVFPHSGLCEFHICALCLEVSHHGLFAKIPSLPLSPEISGVGGGSGCMECKHTPKDLKSDDLVKIRENP